MDQAELLPILLRQLSDTLIENTALKHEVAGLKTRLTDAYELCNKETRRSEAHQKELNRLTEELIRRGADDPWEPKPPCDTAFAALQAVCKWDRDECVADLRKQRAERLRRIDALRSGRELQMADVMEAMNKDYGSAMENCFTDSLHYVLREMREQLSTIFDALKSGTEHEEWFKYPLNVFRQDRHPDMDDVDDDMEDDEEDDV